MVALSIRFTKAQRVDNYTSNLPRCAGRLRVDAIFVYVNLMGQIMIFSRGKCVYSEGTIVYKI